MLTNEQIENQDYTINDIADIKHRLDIAARALELVITALQHEQPHKAYEIAVNDFMRVTGEHAADCDKQTELLKTGEYACACELINPLAH